MATNSNERLPTMFGYDEDKFLDKFDTLMQAVRNSTTDSDVIRLVDILAEDQVEASLLTWCVAKAGMDIQEQAADALFEGMMNIVIEMLESIEDEELGQQLAADIHDKLSNLKTNVDNGNF